MSQRLSIFAGFVVGIAVAALVLGGIVAFAPDPVPTAQPTPSPAVVPSRPGVRFAARFRVGFAFRAGTKAAGRVGLGDSLGLRGGGRFPAAGGWIAGDHCLARRQVRAATGRASGGRRHDGIVRYCALGGIGADVMVQGLSSVMPGVNVTP